MSILSSPRKYSSTNAPSVSAATAKPSSLAEKPSSAARGQSGRISMSGWSSESDPGEELICGFSNVALA